MSDETAVDLREDGLLWLINRVVFHPRGFALAYNPADGTFTLLGDGREVWSMGDNVPQDHLFAAAEALFMRVRLNADRHGCGHICCVPVVDGYHDHAEVAAWCADCDEVRRLQREAAQMEAEYREQEGDVND